MILAIGTKSPPKVKAIQEASQTCVYFKGEKIEIISEKVESGVSDMPISLEENIAGAKNRANNVKKLLKSQNKAAEFYIGMEGGTTLIGKEAFLFGVVYIINSNGEEHYGISNLLQLPSIFQKKIYDEGMELGPILEEITGEQGAAQKGGSFAHWTDGQLTRKDQFMLAFIGAISPFYNKYYKL